MIILAVVRSGLVAGSLGLILCLGLVFNISGGMVDIVSAVYFGLVHWRANRFMLLYDDGAEWLLRGGVRQLVVYTIMWLHFVAYVCISCCLCCSLHEDC